MSAPLQFAPGDVICRNLDDGVVTRRIVATASSARGQGAYEAELIACTSDWQPRSRFLTAPFVHRHYRKVEL
ncbi:MAG: hypothetical protein AAGA42_02450 [Actinomycetota bacterium]